MNEKALQARREYKRKWQQDNPDKVKRYQETYWTRKAEAAAETASRPTAETEGAR